MPWHFGNLQLGAPGPPHQTSTAPQQLAAPYPFFRQGHFFQCGLDFHWEDASPALPPVHMVKERRRRLDLYLHNFAACCSGECCFGGEAGWREALLRRMKATRTHASDPRKPAVLKGTQYSLGGHVEVLRRVGGVSCGVDKA